MSLHQPLLRRELLDGRRLVFVGGMHRSGTTLLAQALAAHPDVSTTAGSGMPRDEGQQVRSVFRPANAFGGSGSFARHPEARLRAADASPDARQRLSEQWSSYWDLGRRVLVQKSPPNLIRTTYLQGVFPGARFVIILRHPVVVTLATRKRSRHTLGHLLDNWATGHEIFAEDAGNLDQVFILSYEHLTAEPANTLVQLFAWLGLDFDPVAHGDQVAALTSSNQAYWSLWQRWRRQGLRGVHARALRRRHGDRLEALGYSMHHPAPDMDRWRSRVPAAEVL